MTESTRIEEKALKVSMIGASILGCMGDCHGSYFRVWDYLAGRHV